MNETTRALLPGPVLSAYLLLCLSVVLLLAVVAS